MRPLRLLLDGFGTYREPADIDFTDVEFFALVGPTGSGKSTVIDGLCFALYGTVPRWNNQTVIEHALAPSANSCRVCLVFEAAGARYVAVRVLARNKRGGVQTKEARLERLDSSVAPDGDIADILAASVEQLAEGDHVTAAVGGLLGLTYEHFTQCVLLPQGKFAEFLQATGSQRQDLLVHLLAYGIYEQIGQRARERARTAKDRLEFLQQERDELEDATEDAERAAKARVTALTRLDASVDERLATLETLRSVCTQAVNAARDNGETVAVLAAVKKPAGVSEVAVKIAAADKAIREARERRDELDKAEDAAREARERLGDVNAYTQWQAGYVEQDRSTLLTEQQGKVLAAAETAERTAKKRLDEATADVERCEGVLEAARQAHAAIALAHTLHAGDECPVCLRRVTSLPHHDAPADLDDAQAKLIAAKKQEKVRGVAVTEAAKNVAAARRDVQTTQTRLGELQTLLADAPPQPGVETELTAISAADATLADASTAARKAREALSAAETSRRRLDTAEQQARVDLNTTRDRLVSLGAPPLPTDDLARAWDGLLEWTQQQRAARAAQQPALDEAAATAGAAVERCAEEILVMLVDHGIDTVTDAAQAKVAVATSRAHADAELKEVRAVRKRAADLDRQLTALKEEYDVATMLGDLLKATRFERWLCGEALDSLVTEASATLMELSGDQYELDRNDKNEFVVIDYNDAGTRRPVHTLSGGETFQASLALALALSRQVVDLSAGRRDLDSMFLDEGFGTLDENTLDTVASTLERLAADQDRMVGVVTHVPALAERVPVQFVVTRDGASSHVSKAHT